MVFIFSGRKGAALDGTVLHPSQFEVTVAIRLGNLRRPSFDLVAETYMYLLYAFKKFL